MLIIESQGYGFVNILDSERKLTIKNKTFKQNNLQGYHFIVHFVFMRLESKSKKQRRVWV